MSASIEEILEEGGKVFGHLFGLVFVVLIMISVGWLVLSIVMGGGECTDIIASIDSEVGQLQEVDYITTLVFRAHLNHETTFWSDGEYANCTVKMEVPILGNLPFGIGDLFKFDIGSMKIKLRYGWYFGDPNTMNRVSSIHVDAGEKDIVVSQPSDDVLVFIAEAGQGDEIARGINSSNPNPGG